METAFRVVVMIRKPGERAVFRSPTLRGSSELRFWLLRLAPKERWKAWAGAVCGGKRERQVEAILYAVWEHWIVAGRALERRRPSLFKESQWWLAGTLGPARGEWLVDCQWVHPHHGSGQRDSRHT